MKTNDAFTCKVYTAGKTKTPARIRLLGDKKKQIESAQHVIEFPGGAIEVSRCSDGTYWAHIIVNRKFAQADCEGMMSSLGEIVGGRIDHDNGVAQIPNLKNITQIALLIKPV